MSFLLRKLLGHHVRAEGDDAGGGGDDHLVREQEMEASRKGWIPKHKYSGPEGKWKDAATFLADGAKFNGRLQEELATVKRELADFKGTAKQFSDFQQRQIEARDSQIGDLVRDLKRQQREAIRDGNDEMADSIDDRIEILNDERANVKQQIEKTKQGSESKSPSAVVDENGNTNDPVVRAWIDEGNSWFNDSKPMRDYCFALANEAIANGETKRGRPFLDLMRERMEEAFPLKFAKKNDPTSRGSMTEAGGGGAGGGKSYSVNDLPEADRELMKTGIRQGWTSEATFLKNYFSDEPHIHRSAEKKK
jgi:hypothetical protein